MSEQANEYIILSKVNKRKTLNIEEDLVHRATTITNIFSFLHRMRSFIFSLQHDTTILLPFPFPFIVDVGEVFATTCMPHYYY